MIQHPPNPRTETSLTPLLPRLRSRARRLCSCPADAEDLVQETALRLWQVLVGPDPITAPERYAMITLHNLARQGWRRQRPTEELCDEIGGIAPDAPGRIACAELRAAVTRLPPDQQRLMVLILQGETSPLEIAARTGLPTGTVMSRLARARSQLRQDMGMARQTRVAELL